MPLFVRKIEEGKNKCEYVNEHRNGCREKVCFTLAVLSHESAFMEFCRNHEHSYIPVFAPECTGILTLRLKMLEKFYS